MKIRKFYYLGHMWYHVTYPSGNIQVAAAIPSSGLFSSLDYVLAGRAHWYRAR